MCQRVIIAMALAHSTKLLLADEPTAGLDVTISRQILDLMHELVRDFSTSLVLVSRDLGVVAHYCERVAVMFAGRIVEVASVPVFFSGAAHPYSRHLIRAAAAARDTDRASLTTFAERSDPVRASACSYVRRCPVALPHCAQARPELEPVAAGHLASCFRRAEVAARHRGAAMTLVEVQDLVKHFPAGRDRSVKAVNGVSFAIERGEALALVGESGSGKTTVGRCLLRLLEPTAGRHPLRRARRAARCSGPAFRPLRRRIQMVFQEPYDSLNPRMRIGTIVGEPLAAGDRSCAASAPGAGGRGAGPGRLRRRACSAGTRTS